MIGNRTLRYISSIILRYYFARHKQTLTLIDGIYDIWGRPMYLLVLGPRYAPMFRWWLEWSLPPHLDVIAIESVTSPRPDRACYSVEVQYRAD